MPINGNKQTKPEPGVADEQLRDVRTRLNKHRLQLIFSYLGQNDALDDKIRLFKQHIQQTRNEDERDGLFDNVIASILEFSDAREMQDKSDVMNHHDLLIEFLRKLSISHANGNVFVDIRKQLQQLKQEQEQIKIINELVKLLTSETSISLADKKTIVLDLLDFVSLPKQSANKLNKLKQTIYDSEDEADLGKKLRTVADVLNEINKRLQKEFDAVREYLKEVLGQLGQFNESITDSLKQNEQSSDASRILNQKLTQQHESLQNSIEDSSDLEEIRKCVKQHIEIVNENLQLHFQLQEKVHDQSDKNLITMQSQLGDMREKCNELETQLKKARREALHDALTGLPNRLALDERFDEEFARHKRYGNQLSCAVMDIDHFKSVNDNWGHKAGDRVLQAVAEVCKENMRESDFIARFGGEEFVVLMPETPLQEAEQAMNKLREKIQKAHFHYSEETVPVTISIGIAVCHSGDNTATVFKRADDALYKAKHDGRNQVVTELSLKAAA